MYENILITGGTGFIGSHLAARLAPDNNVVVIERDELSSTWLDVALRECTKVRGDVLNQKLLRRVLTDYRIQQVYHLAAQAIVSAAIQDPISAFEVNVVGTANLLDAVRHVDPDMSVVVQSTDKVYGDNRMNVSEEDSLGSTIGIYETSKVAEDVCARAFIEAYDMDKIRIARPSNTYGYDLAPRIIPNTIRECLQEKEPVIYEGQEKTIRQYIYVEDLVSALMLIMKKTKLVYENPCFNVGTNDVLTQNQVVTEICRQFNTSPRFERREKPIKEIQAQSVDWRKLGALGWEPKFSFQHGIETTIKLFKKYGW